MPERYEATVAADNVFPGDSAKWHTYISSVTSEMSVDGIDSVCRNCRNALNELAYVFQVPDARLELRLPREKRRRVSANRTWYGRGGKRD